MGEEMKEFLGEAIKEIDEYLLDFWNNKKQVNQKFALGQAGKELIDQYYLVNDGYVNRGKRVRGGLVLAGYRAINNNSDWRKLIPMACGIELIHSFLLIEDDFMDQDESRRSVMTAHKGIEKWLKSLALNNDEVHLSESLAVNLGLIINFWAMELILKAEIDEELRNVAMKQIVRVLEETGFGQAQDLFYEVQTGLSESEIIGMAQWKSGEYTIAGPLVLGGILGGANEQQLQAMREYGLKVGVAFQIKDDELGIFGDSEVTGKPSGNDIRTGKHTLFKKYAIDLALGEEKDFLEKSFGNRSLSETEINQIREIIIKVGSRDKAIQKAKSLVEQGKKQVALITTDDYWRKVLIQFADYMVNREK